MLKSSLPTTIGVILGTASVLALTSETSRRSKPYWWASDHIVTPLFRLFDPERAHQLAILSLRAHLHPLKPIITTPTTTTTTLSTTVFGLHFPTPIGMAAGFDKQGICFDQVLEMGFSFIEVGGVTPKPQPGNEKPRMWRLVQDKAVINRFGFNSDGIDIVAPRLFRHKPELGIIGVNITKNTSSTELIDDYVIGIKRLGPLVNFIVVNVSCPNVGWTKNLQTASSSSSLNDNNNNNKKDEVKELVIAVRAARDEFCKNTSLLIKLGPDMDEPTILKMATIAIECGVDGLVISNTTSTRPESLLDEEKIADKTPGGLSGQPLKPLSLSTLKQIYRITRGVIPIIGVGGVSSGQDAYERIRAGASLIQLYTALIYEGPGLIHRITSELDELIRKDGFKNVKQVVGIDVERD
jgi:dihydroorotate dehydrogenase